MNLLIAWRSILRHARRTTVTVSALVVGLTGMVVFQGFLSQMMRGFRDGTILSGVGHLQIAASPRYFVDGEFNPFAYPITDTDALMAALERDPDVVAAFPSTGFVAVAGKGDQSATLLVKGFPAHRMYFAPGTGVVTPPTDRFNLGTLVAGAAMKPGDRGPARHWRGGCPGPRGEGRRRRPPDGDPPRGKPRRPGLHDLGDLQLPGA